MTFSTSSDTRPADITAFWREAGPLRWWAADPAFDAMIRDRFERIHWDASSGRLKSWEQDATGALALVLLTDQFPRNLYRDSAHAFASDALARNVADRALERGFDRAAEPLLRGFFYMPLQHHEDAGSQARAVALFARLATETGDNQGLDYARLHAGLIARFGRFPHRN
ncbi:MAG TPA: DUF924 family protein, partial [Rhizomicrobium sp.]|nr:DUF924 family protein [Rhizomicrobium sp.]